MTSTDDSSSKPLPPSPTTYVFVGQDDTDGRPIALAADIYTELEKGDKKIKMVRNEDYDTLKKSVAAIEPPESGAIKPDINIVFDCHGGNDETYEWSPKEKGIPWSSAFSELSKQHPGRINSIIVYSCFGGNAVDALKKLSPGTLLISVVGAKNVGSALEMWNTIDETGAVKNPIDILIKAYDNFDAKDYYEGVKSTDSKVKAVVSLGAAYHDNYDSERALPTIIGIGGNPPVKIDLPKEMKQIQSASLSLCNKQGFDEKAWSRAVDNIHQQFDTKHFRIILQKNHHWSHLSMEDQLSNLIQFMDGLPSDAKQKLSEKINKFFKDSITPPITPENIGHSQAELQKAITTQYPGDPYPVETFLEKLSPKELAKYDSHARDNLPELEQKTGLGPEAEKALQQQIDTIAKKIRNGEEIGNYKDAAGKPDVIKNADELRIAYALTAKYLDESGQITALQQKQRDAAAPHKLAQLTGIPETKYLVSVASLESYSAPLPTPVHKMALSSLPNFL